MNDKRRIWILLRILDQIQKDNEDARNGIEKSIASICKEGRRYFFLTGILYFVF